MGRDDDIEAIVELGRRTRKPTPRGLWIAAGIVGAICATGFVMMMRADPAPLTPLPVRRAPERDRFGAGLEIGAVAGLVIGFASGRHGRGHSSRNSP